MKFHTQLKAKDIFKFSLAYTYSGVQAILTIFMLGVGAYMIVHGIGQPEGQTNIIFGVVVIALFVVINPLMIYVKAKKQAIENPVYKNPTYYTLRDDGIFVELGEESATIEWNRVYKITHFMGLTLLYTGKQQAFVFPDYELLILMLQPEFPFLLLSLPAQFLLMPWNILKYLLHLSVSEQPSFLLL